jgi:hypothetical protein
MYDDEAVLDQRPVLAETLAVLNAVPKSGTEQVEQVADLDLTRPVAAAAAVSRVQHCDDCMQHVTIITCHDNHMSPAPVARGRAALELDGGDGLACKIHDDLQ